MSDLVAVPRADLARVLGVARLMVPTMSGTDRQAFEAVIAAARGPVVLKPPVRPPYDDQAVIAEIRRLRGADGAGLSFRRIAEVLNKAGTRAPSGGLWRSETVRRIVRRG